MNFKAFEKKWTKLKTKWPNYSAYRSKRYTAMNKVGVPFHQPLKDRCFFCSIKKTPVRTATNPVGEWRNAPPNKSDNAPLGNSRVAIFVGSSTVPFVTAMFTKNGPIKWKSAGPVRCLPMCFKRPPLLFLDTYPALSLYSDRRNREGCIKS